MKSSTKKRIISFMLCMVLVLSSATSVFADEMNTNAEPQSESVSDTSDSQEVNDTPSPEEPEVQEEIQEEVEKPPEEAEPEPEVSEPENPEQVSQPETPDPEEPAQSQPSSDSNPDTSSPAATTYDNSYSDELVEIKVHAEAGIIPSGAELVVTPIVKAEITTDMSEEEKAQTEAVNAQYDLTEKKLNESNENTESELSGFIAYDISFVSDGKETEPDGSVSVEMNFKKATKPDGASSDSEVSVKHLKEVSSEEDGIKVEDITANTSINATDNAEVKKVEMTSDSFSTFVIQWKDRGQTVTVSYVDSNGNSLRVKTQNTVTSDDAASIKELAGATLTDNNKTYYFMNARIDNPTSGMYIEKIIYKRNKKTDTWYYDSADDSHKLASKPDTIYAIYGDLSTVNTVDSTSAGITMRLIDMETKGDNHKAIAATSNGTQITLNGPYSQNGEDGRIKQGLLQPVLGSDGYPITNTQNSQSLSPLFSGGTAANHLFRQDILESTGYYEYSSFQNYAYYNSDSGNFTVYDQIGTPKNEDKYFYQRGNFMPYNTISADNLSTNRNLYDENGTALSKENARYNETLYKTNGGNYYFGLYTEANFLQPKKGITSKGSNMRYEFNGDDDLWVYIDNVLVLDLGGVHDAHSGYIDFATGEVGWYDCAAKGEPVLTTTTIKALFEAAGKFPDNSAWNSATANDYFTGNTFKDYGSHSFKMFYMERGAGASNLHVKFNLEILPKGVVEVTKKLTNTDKQKYSSVEFGFQLWAQKVIGYDAQGNEKYSDSVYEPITANAVNADTREPITFVTKTYNNRSYDGVFILKDGETAQFTDLQQNRKYYVVEVGVNAKNFDRVIINGTEYLSYDENDQLSGTISNVTTPKEAVSARPKVVCQNNCSTYNLRELQITKKMAEGQTTNDTFTFKIQLTDKDNRLIPYANGDYYLKDAEGNYYIKNSSGTLTSNGQQAAVCGQTDANGLVTDIPAGYTVTVTQILSTTNFLVEEVDPGSNYASPVKEVVPDTCDPATVNGADGSIALGKNAQVIITNSLKESLQITKVWTGSDTKPTADVYIGLYNNGAPVSDKYLILTASGNYTGTFTELPSENYTVKELRETTGSEQAEFTINNKGYIGVSAGDSITLGGTSYKVTYSDKTLDSSRNDLFKIQVTNSVTWQLKKISDSSTTTKLYLKDAEFTFKSADKEIYGKSDENGLIHFYSDQSFNTEISDLSDGTYTITETKAPSGYSLNASDWTLTVENGNITSLLKGSERLTSSYENGMITFYLTNTAVYDLPSAGSSGIFWYMIGGLILMLTAVWILYKNKRREVLKR